jgi:aminopeptidase
MPNLPTEEVFTLPDRLGVSGTVRSTKPLCYRGVVVEGLRLTFEDGAVTDHSVDSGQEAVRNMLGVHESMSRLGEVALVSHSTPLSQMGLLFYDGLFGENASCHLAFGNAYRYTLEGGMSMTDEEFAAAGGNVAPSHVDFMIGSDQMDVDGIRSDGVAEPIMRAGEWAFDL